MRGAILLAFLCSSTLTQGCDGAVGVAQTTSAACGSALAQGRVERAKFERCITDALAGPLKEAAVVEIDATLELMQDQLANDPVARLRGLELACELGKRLGSFERLRDCTELLTAIAPDGPSTLSYRRILTSQAGSLAAARESSMTQVSPASMR